MNDIDFVYLFRIRKDQKWCSSPSQLIAIKPLQYDSIGFGSLMQNMRNNRNKHRKWGILKNGRAVYTTNDLGETWQRHASHQHSLIEPVCMGCL